MISLFRTTQTMRAITDAVIVAFSGGKDSVVALDVCVKRFKTVHAFYMYLVGGLTFSDRIIKFYEDRYGLKIHKMPHFMLSEWLRYGTFRPADYSVPIVSPKNCYDYVRELTGGWWIGGGERIADSVWRRAMIKNSGSIDEKRGKFYPLADWTKSHVLSYIRQNRLMVGEESAKLGFSFRSLLPEDMVKIKAAYPQDYETVKKWFPLVEAGVKHHEFAPQSK